MRAVPTFDITTEHGEGPIWDDKKQQFYWVDLLQGKYHKGNWNTKKVETYSIGQPLGFFGFKRKSRRLSHGRSRWFWFLQ